MSRLTPGDVPAGNRPVVATPSDEDLKNLVPGRLMVIPSDDDMTLAMIEKLQELRAPFPEGMIEKLPKPLWGGAWGDDKARCNVCHGYHPIANTIHLDYVGHANTTNRLLEVDPFWTWEPMAYTDQGLPLFTDGGLWIKLTVCGMTRLGFGDGKSVKEVIGDAIRNAAMRFGVALDLWSKIDLHSERNPSVPAPAPQNARREVHDRPRAADAPAANQPPRAVNQDALDELLSICNKNGLDPREVEATYNEKYGPPVLTKADPDDIRNYAALILEQIDGGSDQQASGGPDPGDEQEPGADAQGGVADDPGGEPEPPADPTDTSDVMKKDGDLF